MLALQACYGLLQVASHKERIKHKHKTLQAFAKLGGKQLGNVHLHKVSQTNLVQTIKDLQRQASLLLRHPKRTSNYMKLVLDNIALPSLTYRDDMTEEDKHKALRCLQDATHGSKLELSWDEDNSQALRVLRKLIVDGYTHKYIITLKLRTSMPELGALAYLDRFAQRIESVEDLCSAGNLDLVYLEHLPNVRKFQVGVGGTGATTIKTWHFARNLGLEDLTLDHVQLEAPCFAELKHLKRLYLLGTKASPSMLIGCDKLEKLTLSGYTEKEVAEFRLMMPNVLIHVKSALQYKTWMRLHK